jgi:tricorn protease
MSTNAPRTLVFAVHFLGFAFSGVCACASTAALESTPPRADSTLLLQEPTLSARHIVFRYADDLWIVPRAGGEASRLTSSPGRETSAQLSPDGQLVAFSAQYEGNTDVYVISIDGGVPRRLTWHPDADTVLDWTPDGQGVVFRSYRFSPTRTAQAFRVGLEGGTPTAYALPKVHHAALDDDASHFAYTPIADAFGTWKRYRGGRLATIWIFDRATQEVEVVPHVKASDTLPSWLGPDIYFASDRDGVMNLFRFTPGGRAVEQLTHFTDFHIRSLDAAHGAVVFEQAGALHLYDPRQERATRLEIHVRTDGLESIPRWQPVKGHVREARIAPNGKRVVFEARGEIITLPREHGDARNLTNSPGVHERSPIWSPDGTQIAWLSDAGGEYRLVLRDRLGREEPRTFELGGVGFYYAPRWSPDGKHILFADKGNRLAFVTLESGEVTDVASVQGSLGTVEPGAAWSPDSKWIAFENRNPRTLYDHVALFELATGRVTSVTDDFAASAGPAFSGDGKYLFFSASVNRGPTLMGLNMTTSATREWDSSLYVAVLQADGENPLFPKSDDAVGGDEDEDDSKDEEKGEKAEAQADESADADGEGQAEAEPEEPAPSIDLEGLSQRVLALPLPAGDYRGLACTKTKLYFIERSGSGPGELKNFDFDEKKAQSLKADVRDFELSADGKALLLFNSGFSIADAKAADAKALDIDKVMVRVEPRAEWPQILREVWRIERDYFYDANMHGVDWAAMWTRWQAFLPHVQHRSDLTLLIRELIGELACGHEYVSGGESADPPKGISVGLLGADFELADGRYRLARVLEGQNWNPGQRSPLTEPGVDARVGDYLIAVNGRPLPAGQNLYQAFEDTADKQVELTLSAHADGSEARSATVVPVASERSLRSSSWVEQNRKRVDELSGGRLAYVYMPNTGGRGQNAFDRDFYSQLDKQGLVLDERYNGGGQVADYVIETLGREVMTLWRNREEWLGYSPSGVLDGPKVMIINEYAGSGGDWMPWAFKDQQLGPLVGTRTWGGLVGISNYPPLMDGGSVTAANFGVLSAGGDWIVENEGVSPDVEVIEWPRLILAGGDPQLETAVRLALEELERRPPRAAPAFRSPAPR